MGSDEEKAEKKRLKARYKLEKKRMKMLAEAELDGDDAGKSSKKAKQMKNQTGRKSPQDRIERLAKETEKIAWYRDPEWIRALVAIASLVVAVISITLTLR